MTKTPLPDKNKTPPIASWDAADWSFWQVTPSWQDRVAWVERTLGNGRYIHRIEFYLVDVPFAVVYRYEHDDEGRFMIRDEIVAEAPPVIFLLDELPPQNLL